MSDAEITAIRELYKGVDDPAVHALLAHIDALAAQVERLKAHMAECDRQEILRVSSLRDLVREARQLIGDSHPTAQTWLEKAAKV